MNSKLIDSFTYLVEKRRDVSKAEQSCTNSYVTKKFIKENNFVWKPVTIFKLNSYLNVRMESFICWECVESLCSLDHWTPETQ